MTNEVMNYNADEKTLAAVIFSPGFGDRVADRYAKQQAGKIDWLKAVPVLPSLSDYFSQRIARNGSVLRMARDLLEAEEIDSIVALADQSPSVEGKAEALAQFFGAFDKLIREEMSPRVVQEYEHAEDVGTPCKWSEDDYFNALEDGKAFGKALWDQAIEDGSVPKLKKVTKSKNPERRAQIFGRLNRSTIVSG